jgi:hypothetical protein
MSKILPVFGMVRLISLAVGAPGFNPLVPPTPLGLDVAEAPADVADGPTTDKSTGLEFQSN